jgi:hypothetical protein
MSNLSNIFLNSAEAKEEAGLQELRRNDRKSGRDQPKCRSSVQH